jgi:hypothetical protein
MHRLVAVLLLCGLAGSVHAAGPVDELRAWLRAPVTESGERGRAVADWVQRPHSLLELGEALLLAEWRDADPDGDVARIDQAARDAVFEQFTTAAREVLTAGQPRDRITVAGLLMNIGSRMTDAGSCRRLGRAIGPDLAALLAREDVALAEAACRALSYLHPPADVVGPGWLRLMESREPRLRLAAVTGSRERCRLAEARSQAALGDGRFTRQDVLEAARDVLPVFDHGLVDPHPQIRAATLAAIRVLAQMNVAQRGLEPLSEPEQLALQGLLAGFAGQIAPISAALSGNDPALQLLAIQTLDDFRQLQSRCGNPAGPLDQSLANVPGTVAGCLASADGNVRLAAAHCLESFGSAAAPAVTRLTDALGDPNSFVRWSAVRALGKIGSPAAVAVPSLAALLLDDAEIGVRRAAAAALRDLGPGARPAVPALLMAIEKQSAPEVRAAALVALEATGVADSPAAAAVISHALADPDSTVRELAVRHFDRTGKVDREANVLLRARPAADSGAQNSSADAGPQIQILDIRP